MPFLLTIYVWIHWNNLLQAAWFWSIDTYMISKWRLFSRIYSGFLFVLRTSDIIHRPCFSSSRIAVSKVFFVSDLLKKLTSVRASFKLSDALYIIDWCNAMSDQNSFRLWTLKKILRDLTLTLWISCNRTGKMLSFSTKKSALIVGIYYKSQDLTLLL